MTGTTGNAAQVLDNGVTLHSALGLGTGTKSVKEIYAMLQDPIYKVREGQKYLYFPRVRYM